MTDDKFDPDESHFSDEELEAALAGFEKEFADDSVSGDASDTSDADKTADAASAKSDSDANDDTADKASADSGQPMTDDVTGSVADAVNEAMADVVDPSLGFDNELAGLLGNKAKVAEYIYTCRQMGIKVLAPDINEGEFTAEGDHVRYGMYAIKSLGRPVIDQIIEERESGGRYRTLSDFIERTCQKELINKRAIENLIKAGACDSLDGTRKQMAMVYASIVDRVQHDKKSTMAGQMSLFDLVSDEDRQSFELKYPNVGEYDAEEALAYEKEVLGIYLSGHPLEKYAATLKKNITANAIDFVLEEESGAVKIEDNAHVVIGGMIAAKTIKFTKYNQAMAFITIEDLTGTVEVIIFPRDYERYQRYLQDDAKIFVIGHATVEDEQNGKIICEKIIPFDELPKQLWLRFDTMEDYKKNESRLLETIRESDGGDEVIIYIADTKQMKKLGRNYSVNANNELMEQLLQFLDKENAKIVEKNIEKMC